MGIKQMAAVLGLAFAVTLAIIVGRQMTTEAMAVVIGVVCGVLAGIPTSVLLLVAMTRRDSLRAREETAARQAPAGYPPVVVIQGGGMQPAAAGPVRRLLAGAECRAVGRTPVPRRRRGDAGRRQPVPVAGASAGCILALRWTTC